MKRTAKCTLRAFGAQLLTFATFYVAFVVVTNVIHPALCEWFPDIFKVYNSVTEKEALEEVNRRIRLVSALIAFFVMPIIERINDNARFEFIVDKTDGFYTVREGLPIYFKSYLVPDIIASLLSPIPLVFALLIRMPERAAKYLGFLLTPCEPYRAIFEMTNLVSTYFTVLAISLAAEMLCAVCGLIRWRGLWLSEIE